MEFLDILIPVQCLFQKQLSNTKNKLNKNISTNILVKQKNSTNLRNILEQLLSLHPPPQPNDNDDAKGNAEPTLQVLVATGSVASVKVPEIAKALVDFAEAQKMKGKA